MFKIINRETGYAVMNGIDKNTRIYLPNGNEGRLNPYTVIEAVTIGNTRETAKTFVLLEHEELGEEDMVIARLPQNGKLWVMFKEDHKDVCNGIHCRFINASLIEVGACYNGFDDLEDAGWDLSDAQYWTNGEINDK